MTSSGQIRGAHEICGLEDEVIAKAAEISGETGDAFIVDAEDEYAKALRLYYETR